MHVLALAASNSRNSINKALVSHAAQLLEGGLIPDTTVEVLDINDYEMAIYSQDRQDETGIPEQAQRFYDKIGAADAVLISYAEHNGSYSAAFKNLYDWTSRIDMAVYQGKPVAMLATSPGGRGGQGVLAAATTTAPFFGANLVGSLSVPFFHDNFDVEAGELTNPELSTALTELLSSLAG